MMPQVVLQDDDLSWQDAPNETSLVSYCFLVSSIIPQERGSGKPQVVLRDGIQVSNDDAAGHASMRGRLKPAMMPQVVL
jgi:hypothetical protein